MIGRDDVIHLRRREILVRPRLAAVDGHLAATVVGFDHAPRILRVYPEIMGIPMSHSGHRAKRAAAVCRALE